MTDRPAVAAGHIIYRAGKVAAAAQFFRDLGLRPVHQGDDMAIFELRGGTHILIFPAKKKITGKRIRNFDLMVDDLAAFNTALKTRGLAVGEIATGGPGGHSSFEVCDPDGRALTVYSSHTEGRTV